MIDVSKVNRSLISKKVDNFYVSFYEIPENEANILGRQVVAIERPSPTFSPAEIRHKGVKQQVITTLEFPDISVTFKDDDSSLALKALYAQLYRQVGKMSPIINEAKFTIGVKCYTAAGDVAEEFSITNCFIINVTHTEQIYADSTDNEIIVTIGFDSVDYKFVEGPLL